MKFALQFNGVAAAFGQPSTAMLADVVIRGYPVGARAHDNKGFVCDIVGDVVTDLRNLFNTAGHLPYTGP